MIGGTGLSGIGSVIRDGRYPAAGFCVGGAGGNEIGLTSGSTGGGRVPAVFGVRDQRSGLLADRGERSERANNRNPDEIGESDEGYFVKSGGH